MIGQDDRRYQVFISSTFEDLQEERQQVLQAVLEMQAFPDGMELFPSADDEQWEFIKREIESSDYYILITAGKYGSLAPDGISFTEKEYDYAISCGKYIMSFLRRDLSRLEARWVEKDESRRLKLEAFHAKVKRNRLVKFYDRPAELKPEVMQALRHAFQFRPREGWVRAKNARRIEDLEDLTRLQKRVMELEAENARLSADPTAAFAQGDDAVEWEVHLGALVPGRPANNKKHLDPPVGAFLFRTTWNELLGSVFAEAHPDIDQWEAQTRVEALIGRKIAEQFPAAEEWAQMQAGSGAIAREDMTALITTVKRQFLGLGLIDSTEKVDAQYMVVTHWVLTPRGRLQLLQASGLRRDRNRSAAGPS